jgi:hypothetical protein
MDGIQFLRKAKELNPDKTPIPGKLQPKAHEQDFFDENQV